jgi:hypothetical protein
VQLEARMLGEPRLHRGNRGSFLGWWALTIALGATFLACTAKEWIELIGHFGLTISRNLFGSTYFTLVGFHAAHVTVGVLLLVLIAMSTCGSDDHADPVACTEENVPLTFDACTRAETEAECVAACGVWGTIGIRPSPECSCGTGEAERPCSGPADCRGACIAPLETFFDCSGVREGTCAAWSPNLGCYCWFLGGAPQGRCLD